MSSKNQILKPTFIVNKKRVLSNIERMVTKAYQSGCKLRAHFKTHQSAAIGEWFREFEIDSIAVSSLDMADYFADSGWKDISVCVPVNVRQIDQINQLNERTTLHVLAESPEAVSILAKQVEKTLNLWVEIDVGYGRTGIGYDDLGMLEKTIGVLKKSPKIRFMGILTHAGHTYGAGSVQGIREIYHDSLNKMEAAQSYFLNQGLENCKISVGDTPSCSIVEKFEPSIDEIRPGNFVFYDLLQLRIGVCQESEIAAAAVCPVIAKYPERIEIVIYGGGVHLSKEMLKLPNSHPYYGVACTYKEGEGWSSIINDAYVKGLSQEHGIISTPAGVLNQTQIGDLFAILPIHSCLTANLATTYQTIEGDTLSSFRL